MPLSDSDFSSIRVFVERMISDKIGSRRDYFVTGKVIKRDELKKLIWLEEFGDQAIPIVAFNYNITYYDETPKGVTTTTVGTATKFKTTKKKVKAEIVVPAIGQTVLVACEMGLQIFPRCLGVIQGIGWLESEED